jgi:hypothetical protein
MATTNTLTGLIPVAYQALATVARERVGSIEAVSTDVDATGVAVGQTVRVGIAPVSSVTPIVPGPYAPQNGGQTIGYTDITITNSDMVPIAWNGEEQKSVGGQFQGLFVQQLEQAFRAHTKAIDAAINLEVRKNSGRAYGTAGQAYFGTAGDLTELAQLNKILDDNGTPNQLRNFVMNSTSRANLAGKQSVLFKVNEAGTSDLLRKNIIDELQGFGLHYSNGLVKAAAGTLSAGTATASAGDTTITITTPTGTVVPGDVVSFAGDTNKYVVLTAAAGANTPSFTIAKPGLINAVSGAAITVTSSYTAGWAGYKGAIQLLNRAPALPAGGDAASDVTSIIDPVTGLAFQLAMYKQYKQTIIEVGIAYGIKVTQPEFLVTAIV